MRGVLLKAKGQSFAEYAIITSIVAISLAAMTTFIQRSIQAKIKLQIDAALPIAEEVNDRTQACKDLGLGDSKEDMWTCTQYEGVRPRNLEELQDLVDKGLPDEVFSVTTEVGSRFGGVLRSINDSGDGTTTTLSREYRNNPAISSGRQIFVGRTGEAAEFLMRDELPNGAGN